MSTAVISMVYLVIIVCLLVIQLVSMIIYRKRYVSAKELKSIEKQYIELLDVYHYVASNNIKELEKKVAELKTLIIQADQRIRSLTVLLGNPQPAQGTYAPSSTLTQRNLQNAYGSEPPNHLPEPPAALPALEASFSATKEVKLGRKKQERLVKNIPEGSRVEPPSEQKDYVSPPVASPKASLRLCFDEPALEDYRDIVDKLDSGVKVEEILKETKASRGVVTILANIQNLRKKELEMREKGVREED
ncbi:MAG: hypothetical protein QGH40_15970 [bacterium]|nr:hypothetical protein [bacterium]